MSPWWRNSIEADVSPRIIALKRLPRGFSAKAEAREEGGVLPAEDSRDWRPALTRLGQMLESLAWRDADLRVVLASSFVRFAALPVTKNLSLQDAQAYARHRFCQLYDEQAVANWAICLSQPEHHSVRIAAAVPAELLAELSAYAARQELRLQSVRPALSLLLGALPESAELSGWLAHVEPGHLCLARIEAGNCVNIRSARCGVDPVPALLTLLNQDALSAALTPAFGKLYLSAKSTLDNLALRAQGWQVLPMAAEVLHAA